MPVVLNRLSTNVGYVFDSECPNITHINMTQQNFMQVVLNRFSTRDREAVLIRPRNINWQDWKNTL